MESSSEEQKECVCVWGSYLSECSSLPAWLIFLCLEFAIISVKQ